MMTSHLTGRSALLDEEDRSAAGFTIIELLVVLAVVASMAAVSMPLMRRPLAKVSVGQAALQLTRDLHLARATAIERGEPYRFDVEPSGARYRILPLRPPRDGETDLSPADPLSESPNATNSNSPANQRGPGINGMSNRDPVSGNFDAELEDGVVFVLDEHTKPDSLTGPMVEMEMAPSSLSNADSVSPRPMTDDGGLRANHSLKTQLVFFPDGRSQAGSLTLRDAEYELELNVRGLTGHVTVGQPKRLREWSESEAIVENEFDEE